VDVTVEIAAEAVDEGYGAEAGARRGAGTTLPDRCLHRPQENLEQAACSLWFLTQMPADPLGHRQHPLAERDPRQNVVDHMGGLLGMTPPVVGGVDSVTVVRDRSSGD